MSRIYFHTPAETVEVQGAERAHIGMLCEKFAAGIFKMLPWEKRQALLPSSRYIERDRHGLAAAVDRAFELYLTGFIGDAFADGTNVRDTIWNTALRFGSGPVQLAARIHAQCEIHGYVEPQDGEFIAGLIEDGLRSGVFRETLPLNGAPTDEPAGWRDVCRVLRSGDVVVSSFSVCDQFPNAGVVAGEGIWSPPEAQGWNAWYELPDDQRWELALRAIRASDKSLAWSEEGWDQFYFGHGRTALDYEAGR